MKIKKVLVIFEPKTFVVPCVFVTSRLNVKKTLGSLNLLWTKVTRALWTKVFTEKN